MIVPYDIVYSDAGVGKHYYLIVYSQRLDSNNELNNNYYGLIITTNDKYKKLLQSGKERYAVPIELSGEQAYICCDKVFMLQPSERTILEEKNFYLSVRKRKEIQKKYRLFLKELNKQVE